MTTQAFDNWEFAGTVTVGTSPVDLFSGTGSPESVVEAVVGSLFLRTDGGSGSTLYVKESGSGTTGWVSLGGVASTSFASIMKFGTE